MKQGKPVKIAYVGGGSQNWAPSLIRDIIFKRGMERVRLDIRLLDIDVPRAHAIESLFDVKLREWGVDRVKVTATADATDAISGADFVMITISTGRLEAMRHDLAIPEKYGIYHTVGDTAGPGGWSRAWRNIPVFKAYADLIKKLAPTALVLNYTNPMGALTKVLADDLGPNKVVGLCHGLFECYAVLQQIFGLQNENEVLVRFAGLNHFFWILDMRINGREGYKLLRDKMRGKTFSGLVGEAYEDAMGFSSRYLLAGELLENYGYLPYIGDRHTCEFFTCYLTNPELMARFGLKRTSIADREAGYKAAAERIKRWTAGKDADMPLHPESSRETAADIIHAIVFNEGFMDVVNTVNTGQIPNLPQGVVVETMGLVDSSGFRALAAGPLPESVRAVIAPHAEGQVRTVQAALAGDKEAALMALVADPLCAHLTVSDIKRMGHELLNANRRFMHRG